MMSSAMTQAPLQMPWPVLRITHRGSKEQPMINTGRVLQVTDTRAKVELNIKGRGITSNYRLDMFDIHTVA